MAYIIADNIISPLGETSEGNYLSVKSGRSGIRAYEPGTCNIPEGFYASLLFEDFETLALRSAQKAIANAQKDIGNERLELKGKRTVPCGRGLLYDRVKFLQCTRFASASLKRSGKLEGN